MLKIPCYGFGDIVKLVDKVFEVVWLVIRKLGLQLLVTVGVVWLFAAAFLPKEKLTGGVTVTFLILSAIALIYAIAATVFNIAEYLSEAKRSKSKKGKKPHKTHNKRDIDRDEEGYEDEEYSSPEPIYYRVAQNPAYVMAEYPDRYELYFDDGGEYKFVKATPKDKKDQEAKK